MVAINNIHLVLKTRIVYDCITYIARRFHSDSRGGTPAEAFIIFVFLIFHLSRARKNSARSSGTWREAFNPPFVPSKYVGT